MNNITKIVDNYDVMYIGDILLNTSIYVCDPYNNPKAMYINKITNMKPGLYHCFIRTVYIDRLSQRKVSSLLIFHEDNLDYPDKMINGNITVYGNTCGFFDMRYFNKLKFKGNYDKESWTNKIFRNTKHHLTIDKYTNRSTIDGRAVVTYSGTGSGCYNLYSAEEDGKTVSALIDFLIEGIY